MKHCQAFRSALRAAVILTLIAAAAPATAQVTIPASSADWIREVDQADANFGSHVASAGDVDGDGFDDVLVGASGFDGAFIDSGRVFLYAGGASGLSTTPSWSFDGDRPGAFLSRALGDVNGDGFHDVDGDGFDDLLVPERPVSETAAPMGHVLIFGGSASGLGALPTGILEHEQQDGGFGTAAGSAHQCDHDALRPAAKT